MFDLLELAGRFFMGLLRLAELIDFISHLFMGFWWWMSPSYRREVQNYETSAKLGVYLGAFFFAAVIIFIAYCIIS